MSRRRAVWPAATLLAAALASCESPTEASHDAHLVVRTDKAVYSLSADSAAAAVLVNLGPETVYAPMNEYVYVQRRTGGGWSEPQPWFAVDGISFYITLHAGDSLVAYPMPFGYVASQPGTYRFLFEIAYDSLGRDLAPEAARASAPWLLQP